MPGPLNPSAPEFRPPVSAPISVPSNDHGLPDDPWAAELAVSPAELEELEEVEGWVHLMAELEGMEQDHLIELSLRHADKSKIAQIKAAAMGKGKHHKHRHHAHKASATAHKA